MQRNRARSPLCLAYDPFAHRAAIPTELLGFHSLLQVKLEHQHKSIHDSHVERVSLLEFRKHAEAIVRRVARGRRLVLTYRNRPMIRLEPLDSAPHGEGDPFYDLARLPSRRGEALSNEEIDKIVYR